MIKKVVLIICTIIPVVLYSQNLDIRILRSINSPQDLPSDGFFRFVSNSEPVVIIGIPLGMGITGLIKHDKKLFRDACIISVASALNEVIVNIIKYSVNRDRPFVTYPDITKKSKGGSPSFPSGHTSSAFATATSLSLEIGRAHV